MDSLEATMALAAGGLTLVVFGTVAFSIVMSVLFLITRGGDSMYDEIGRGGIVRESDYSPDEGAGRRFDSSHEQEVEVRQLVRARSERGVARGEAPLDVDAEVMRLLSGSEDSDLDPALEAEVRQLVRARNERRVRQGLEPLDEDAEIARTLHELDGGV